MANNNSNNNKQTFSLIDVFKDPKQRNLISIIWGKLNALQGVEVAGPFRAPIDHGGFKGINCADPSNAQDVMTLSYAEGHYSPAVMQRALSTGGSNPLSLQALPGATSGGGDGALYGTHAQRIALDLSTISDGTLWNETDTTVWYQLQLLLTAKTWVYVLGAQSGTLSPDLKPTLGTHDAGYLFNSTDFNRVYRWSGSAWADAPGEDDRKYVAMFFATPTYVGWQLADGSVNVPVSTATGTVTTFNTVDFVTASLFPRFDNTIGLTGGAATATHATTDTGVENVVTTVQAGAGTNVAGINHVHSNNAGFTVNTVPPYFTLRPYIRL